MAAWRIFQACPRTLSLESSSRAQQSSLESSPRRAGHLGLVSIDTDMATRAHDDGSQRGYGLPADIPVSLTPTIRGAHHRDASHEIVPQAGGGVGERDVTEFDRLHGHASIVEPATGPTDPSPTPGRSEDLHWRFRSDPRTVSLLASHPLIPRSITRAEGFGIENQSLVEPSSCPGHPGARMSTT